MNPWTVHRAGAFDRDCNLFQIGWASCPKSAEARELRLEKGRVRIGMPINLVIDALLSNTHNGGFHFIMLSPSLFLQPHPHPTVSDPDRQHLRSPIVDLRLET